jgi:hypothetical protein
MAMTAPAVNTKTATIAIPAFFFFVAIDAFSSHVVISLHRPVKAIK